MHLGKSVADGSVAALRLVIPSSTTDDFEEIRLDHGSFLARRVYFGTSGLNQMSSQPQEKKQSDYEVGVERSVLPALNLQLRLRRP